MGDVLGERIYFREVNWQGSPKQYWEKRESLGGMEMGMVGGIILRVRKHRGEVGMGRVGNWIRLEGC